jgi:hypothetical protein
MECNKQQNNILISYVIKIYYATVTTQDLLLTSFDNSEDHVFVVKIFSRGIQCS